MFFGLGSYKWMRVLARAWAKSSVLSKVKIESLSPRVKTDSGMSFGNRLSRHDEVQPRSRLLKSRHPTSANICHWAGWSRGSVARSGKANLLPIPLQGPPPDEVSVAAESPASSFSCNPSDASPGAVEDGMTVRFEAHLESPTKPKKKAHRGQRGGSKRKEKGQRCSQGRRAGTNGRHGLGPRPAAAPALWTK